MQSDTQAGQTQTRDKSPSSLEEDEEGDEDRPVAVGSAGTEYPEAEISGEERDPFADEAPRVQVGD